MIRPKNFIKQGFIVLSIIVLSGGLMPVVAFADDPSTCTPPGLGAGVHKPVGADASTYTYNCASGLWENAHYTYDPTTGVTTPKDPVVYTYNSATGMYDTTVWNYNAPTNNYVPNTVSVTTPPAGATVIGGPAPAPAPSSISNTGPDSNNTITNDGGVGSGSISNTGPNSNNTLGGTVNNTQNDLTTTNAALTNLLTGSAATGNAVVIGNTTGGSATSGDASNMANIVNLLQSAGNALSSNTVTFVANINGDVNGDLTFDPAVLGSLQPADNTNAVGDNNLTLNNQVNAGISNDVNLTSNSGDATVKNNTTAGNATSGSAKAIADVVNVINSAISSGNSFLGVININGNFNGDILMPQNFINALVANNVPTVTINTTGPGSNNTITNNTGSNTTNVTNTNNEGITNNINSTAASGTAAVTNNTSAGNATSGKASNSITAFNLTGSNVIGNNAILVFVNVLGSWVGMIVNAPPGTTAAELGGGVTSNTSGQSNNTTNVNSTTNQQINNNINLASKSGNATVDSNTKAGNATSGDAQNAINLLNVENSNLSLAGWFGILFINVFGNWNGSFGVNTSAGDPIATSNGTSRSTGSVPAAYHVIGFVPHGNYAGASGSSNGNSGSASYPQQVSSAVLAAHISKTNGGNPNPSLHSAKRSLWLPAAAIALFIVFVVADRYAARRSD